MNVNRPAPTAPSRRAIGKLGRPRLLIVGCGDIGLRIVARVHRRFRALALTSNPQRVPLLRAAGAVPIVGNLDDRSTLGRLRGAAARVIHLAPPPESGDGDRRTTHLVNVLGRRDGDRSVYVSTTGVYGDHRGAWIDETARLATTEARSLRRISAERAMRRRRHAHVLRVPGIYAQNRLPVARLQQKLPTLAPEDDVYTSHIHADDLARIAVVALLRGRPCRVTNTVDDGGFKLGEYFDVVADRLGLMRPARLPREELKRAVSPMMYSFMSASRRIRNARLKRELRVRLAFPTVLDALAQIQPAPQPAPAQVTRARAGGSSSAH